MGWTIETLTNVNGPGRNGQWYAVPGSTVSTQAVFLYGSGNNVFFRLRP